MNCMVILLSVVSISEIALCSGIWTKMEEYFQTESSINFKTQWEKFEVSFENTLNQALSTGYGHTNMNVLVNRFTYPLDLSSGFYHTDNQVKILLQDLVLTELPLLSDVDVSFKLASNLLWIDAGVDKMILQAGYMLFRNSSDVIYAAVDQNSNHNSPFRFQQVADTGRIAITMEGCSLSGYVVVSLIGNSVNAGHRVFKLKDCQYNIEIFENETGSPPVLANYVFKGPGLNIESLVLRPLLGELMPKLQGALFSYINTSALFAKDLTKFRELQENIFEDTNAYEDAFIRCMNREAIEGPAMGSVKMNDFQLTLKESTKNPFVDIFKLSDVLLVGLDTLYSAHSGGPVLSDTLKHAQQIRFKTLQVTGKVGKTPKTKFAVEISDLAVNVEVDHKKKTSFEIVGRRSLEFSSLKQQLAPIETFVVAYLLRELPRHVLSYLNTVHSSCDKLNRVL